MKVAVIAGSTGLIGSQLLQLLLKDPEYHLVKAITRSPLELKHSKLQNIITDFDRLDELDAQIAGDVVFCCLGTTMKKAGSKEAFKKVDYSYPLKLATTTRRFGAHQFLLVSALGADRSASIYYNKVKGEVEEAISKVGFQSYHIFRPSLLLGPRDENRPGEDAAKFFYKTFGFLIPQKYKAVDSSKVARAMIFLARQEKEGTHIHESKALQEY
jgi:uncharacterized protein YbjT (DUF2867 family)